MSREAKKRVKLLVEGDTEENYFKEFKNNKNLDFSIKPVNMHGGGYSNFLKKLRKESTMGFLAIFIFLDLDKANQEKQQLQDLINYCNNKNKASKVPYFLIGTNKDFEFFACSHCLNYKKTDTTKYIVNNFKYKSLSEFKSDCKVFLFLNKENRSYKNVINTIKNIDTYFTHSYIKKENTMDITIKSKGNVKLNKDALSNQHSNINEFFDIIMKNND